ncbi:histidine phosphatase family protein [Leptolyngbya cf. ectocarpi LEGE 11479]|uniref:Histidine phosphatase family protein n=1 Tax=Leptolyngbya cf. ectocarpi LEGE 11479 TaxID=1828722 RepID=A0A929F7R1_LEPEC|nr:histidine phosphatase family protein [Leptolyngbya ectocarpi]MBE9068391.1 histidine phosphatase family protein [Leptolyngbya cf. ectocarpi LEGE 11479]
MHPDCSPSRIILVRHGRSTFNDQGRYQGSSDEAVLTLKGIETARQVGDYLRHISIDAVYTSPLMRAKQTAGEILKAMDDKQTISVTVSNYLREIDLSIWEGLTYEYVRHHHKDTYACWQQHPDEFKLPAADGTYHFPINDLYKRAQTFWAGLPYAAGKTILVVSHGGTNHALISTALGLSAKDHHSLQQSNCGISMLEFSGQQVQLSQLNQTTAIKETLPKLKAGKIGLRLLLLAKDGLTATVCDRLAHRLADVKLDFCLATGQRWLPTLLQYHPSITWFSNERENFLQDWQGVRTSSFYSTEMLRTGIAIAPATHIQTLLMKTLGGHPDTATRLALKPGHLSVIHYPKNHRPIVQAINI